MDFKDLTEEQKAKARACKTAEELEALAAKESVELSLDELEEVAGGRAPDCRFLFRKPRKPAKPDVVKFCVDCGATYMESQGHDCPEQ